MDRNALLSIVFRHRSGLLMLLAAPVVIAALRSGAIDGSGSAGGVGGILDIRGVGGLALVAAGVLLRLLAVRRIGRGARVHRAHASAGLIAAGPYRWSRNPLYLAAALMLCGFGLLAGAGWSAGLLLPATLLAYTPVVIAEERALTGLLGEPYCRYLARVPRWIGWPRVEAGEEEGTLVGWREVFRREQWLVPGSLAAVLAIAALRGGILPLRRAVHDLPVAIDLDVGVVVAIGVALAANAIKVELHQRRRRVRGVRVPS